MPRSTHPIDGVHKYFREAPLEAAEQALHIMRGILKARREGPGPISAATPIQPPKAKKRRVKKVKPVADGEMVGAGAGSTGS